MKEFGMFFCGKYYTIEYAKSYSLSKRNSFVEKRSYNLNEDFIMLSKGAEFESLYSSVERQRDN